MLYAYSVEKPIGELNLKRALDEDTGPGVFLSSFPLFHLLLHWVRQLFLGIPPFIRILGVFFFFFILIFCESLALYAKSRGLIYTILAPKVK